MERSSTIKDEFDELGIRNDAALRKKLAVDEKVLLSTIVNKFNKRGKRQERTLLITSKALYNISRQNLITQAISWLSSSLSIKRRIDIAKITGITVSDLSGEFVIHVPDEYDYRYSSSERRDRILQMICRSYYSNVADRPLLFYFKDQIELGVYTTTEDDKKKGQEKVLKGRGESLDEAGMREKSEDYRKRREKMRAETKEVFGKKVTLDDFNLLKVLGRGAFGKVMLVEKKDDKKIYAMKSMRKEDLIDKEQVEHTKTERYVLEKSNCPFLVRLEYAFQTPEKIFFVMRFMKGGELFQHLRMTRRFEEHRTKFYAAEIICALEYLHKLDVVYRDLKPENILLDEEGHICLTDFGMAKKLKPGELTDSFVGTPEYLSPEIIENKGHSMPADWWALGIFVYEMMIGIPPFYNREQNHDQMFMQIREKEVVWSTKVPVSDLAKDFILKLLIKDPTKRLGYKGTAEIKSHPWFDDINWKALYEKKIEPPFKPKVTSDIDVNNFDEEFTREEAIDSFISNGDEELVRKYQREFDNFSFGPNIPRTSTQRDSFLSMNLSTNNRTSVMSNMRDSVISEDMSIPEEEDYDRELDK